MSCSRRRFLGGIGAAMAGAVSAPLLRVRTAFGAEGFSTRRVVILAIGGGLRNREALGMAEGATMPNLFGRVPVISGFGDADAGDPRIAPEYAAAVPALALPTPRVQPLYTEGTLVANLRYAEGAPGHLQGHACLLSGLYNNIENRSDARLPVPTIFELHRRAAGTPATDAWYVSILGGFYRALQTSEHPEFGDKFAGTFVSPPAAINPLVPTIASGERTLDITNGVEVPAIADDAGRRRAVRRLRAILDGNSPAGGGLASDADSAELEDYLAEIYGDPTLQRYFPDSFGIGLQSGDGSADSTGDVSTIYHAEEVLKRFKPSVMAISLLDVDTCHTDFNGYLRAQQIADACAAHLWQFIQSTDGLRDETTLIILPEHGRHNEENGLNPDSFGRSALDHGNGDDGDRDVWMMALGPDIAKNQVIEPTGVSQSGRTSGRYETIDAVRLAMELMGHGDEMEANLTGQGARPGIVPSEVLK